MNASEIENAIAQLEAWIRLNQPAALCEFHRLFESDSVHVMHAHLGRNNNTFVDSVRTQFTDPNDFIARWISGLQEKLAAMRQGGRRRYQDRLFSEEIVY